MVFFHMRSLGQKVKGLLTNTIYTQRWLKWSRQSEEVHGIRQGNRWNRELSVTYNASVNVSGIKWEGGWEGQVTGNSGKALSAAAGCKLCQVKEQKQAATHPDSPALK